jgi:hypothetical protein
MTAQTKGPTGFESLGFRGDIERGFVVKQESTPT